MHKEYGKMLSLTHPNLSSSVRPHGALLGATMKIGLFTEFSYPGKSERQAYAEVLEQISLADELGYDFFSTTESFGKDEVSCSPFPLGLYIAAAQRAQDSFSYRDHHGAHPPSGDLGQRDRGSRSADRRTNHDRARQRASLGIESGRRHHRGEPAPFSRRHPHADGDF